MPEPGQWFRIQSGPNEGRWHLAGWQKTAIEVLDGGDKNGWLALSVCPRCRALVIADVHHPYGDNEWGHEQHHAETDYPHPADESENPPPDPKDSPRFLHEGEVRMEHAGFIAQHLSNDGRTWIDFGSKYQTADKAWAFIDTVLSRPDFSGRAESPDDYRVIYRETTETTQPRPALLGPGFTLHDTAGVPGDPGHGGVYDSTPINCPAGNPIAKVSYVSGKLPHAIHADGSTCEHFVIKRPGA